MEYEFTIKIVANGIYSEEELKDFVQFSLGYGSLSQQNPFVADDGDAEIITVEIV